MEVVYTFRGQINRTVLQEHQIDNFIKRLRANKEVSKIHIQILIPDAE